MIVGLISSISISGGNGWAKTITSFNLQELSQKLLYAIIAYNFFMMTLIHWGSCRNGMSIKAFRYLFVIMCVTDVKLKLKPKYDQLDSVRVRWSEDSCTISSSYLWIFLINSMMYLPRG